MTSPALPGAHLRTILAHVPTPLTAVAAVIDGNPVGMTVGSFLGLSLEPPLVAVSIQKTSSTWPILREAGLLGISVLTEDHSPIVRQLAGPAGHRFDRVNWQNDNGAVLIDGAGAYLRTRLVDEFDTGDHVLAVLRVEDATEYVSSPPLIFHGSRVTTIAAQQRR